MLSWQVGGDGVGGVAVQAVAGVVVAAALELHGACDEAFELVEVTVDGYPRRGWRTVRTGTQMHTVRIGADTAATQGIITLAYRVLLRQHGHLLHLDFPRPTKGLKVHFAYGGCGIDRVNVVDYIASIMG